MVSHCFPYISLACMLRCDRGIGTKISAQKLLKVLTTNTKQPVVDQGGGAALGWADENQGSINACR
jgi:hypothetical protein